MHALNYEHFTFFCTPLCGNPEWGFLWLDKHLYSVKMQVLMLIWKAYMSSNWSPRRCAMNEFKCQVFMVQCPNCNKRPFPSCINSLFFKTSLGAKPFTWKCVQPSGSFSCKSNLFFMKGCAQGFILKQMHKITRK